MALWIVGGLTGLLVLMTVGSLSRNEVWWIRGLDFPRLQFALIGIVLLCLALGLLDFGRPASWLVAGAALACTLYQAWWILPCTRIWRREVRQATSMAEDKRLRIMAANVLTPNRNAAKLLDMVKIHAPHILVAVETDVWWERHLDSLAADYPFSLKCPLDNLFGMHLYSRLPLEDAEIKFLVQDEIPSMHAAVVMPGGERIRLHCLHPAPPSPTENDTSSQRDAELIIVGKSVAESRLPVVVAGDLNDVAWSATTRLFRKISGLLDPRVGRSMCNTYHAKHAYMRWPLDHLFHSDHFTLVRMRRLEYFGSDHFPILVELALEPRAAADESGLQADGDDRALAWEKAQSESVHKSDVPTPGEHSRPDSRPDSRPGNRSLA